MGPIVSHHQICDRTTECMGECKASNEMSYLKVKQDLREENILENAIRNADGCGLKHEQDIKERVTFVR
jgi:hypothetical protein